MDFFTYDLLNSPVFADLFENNDTENIWITWKTEFLRISHKHTPIRNVRVKNRANPWFNSEILDMIHQRDYIHKQAIKNHYQTLFDQYIYLRNKVTSSVRQAKKEFYTSSITECKNDSKLMWKLLKNMIPRKCNSNNTVSSSLNQELFNKYFASIGERLTN